MSARRKSGKAGDPRAGPPFVKLDHPLIDSMAFKCLSPAAVWLYVMLRRQWTQRDGGDRGLRLPFSRVSWRLTFAAFNKARRELIEGGFVRMVDPGGLLNRPAIYALSESWREKSKALAHDPEAGDVVWRRDPATKEKKSTWCPKRKRRSSADNAALARAAKAKRRSRRHKKDSASKRKTAASPGPGHLPRHPGIQERTASGRT